MIRLGTDNKKECERNIYSINKGYIVIIYSRGGGGCDGTCFVSLIKRDSKLAPRVCVFICAFDT